MDLDVNLNPPPSASGLQKPEGERAPRQGDELRPYCHKHQCLMKATSTRGGTTNYACPVPGCESKEKRARPKAILPAEPKPCPQVTCNDPQQYLELVELKSTLVHLHMECPKCKFAVKQPRPDFRPRPQRESLGER